MLGFRNSNRIASIRNHRKSATVVTNYNAQVPVSNSRINYDSAPQPPRHYQQQQQPKPSQRNPDEFYPNSNVRRTVPLSKQMPTSKQPFNRPFQKPLQATNSHAFLPPPPPPQPSLARVPPSTFPSTTDTVQNETRVLSNVVAKMWDSFVASQAERRKQETLIEQTVKKSESLIHEMEFMKAQVSKALGRLKKKSHPSVQSLHDKIKELESRNDWVYATICQTKVICYDSDSSSHGQAVGVLPQGSRVLLIGSLKNNRLQIRLPDRTVWIDRMNGHGPNVDKISVTP